jgi:hypothetical protein
MLGRGLAPKTVRNVMTFLHAVFAVAVANEWIERNPVVGAARPKRRRRGDASPDLQFLTVEQLDAVLAAIPDDVAVSPPAPMRRGRRGPARRRRRMFLVRSCACLSCARRSRGSGSRSSLGCAGRTSTGSLNACVCATRSSVAGTRRGKVGLEHAAISPDDRASPRGARVLARPYELRPRRRPGLRASAARNAARSHQGHEAVPGRVRAGRGAGGALPRSPAHLRDAAGGVRRAVARASGIPGSRGSQDDSDLRALLAQRMGGRDGRHCLLAQGRSQPHRRIALGSGRRLTTGFVRATSGSRWRPRSKPSSRVAADRPSRRCQRLPRSERRSGLESAVSSSEAPHLNVRRVVGRHH